MLASDLILNIKNKTLLSNRGSCFFAFYIRQWNKAEIYTMGSVEKENKASISMLKTLWKMLKT